MSSPPRSWIGWKLPYDDDADDEDGNENEWLAGT